MWPWSRIRELEAKVIRAEAEGDVALKLALGLQERYDALVAKTFELRRLGFEVPPPPGVPIAPDLELPPIVMDAIEERAEPGTPLWNTLKQWAGRQLRAERPEDDVAEEILDGGEVEV